MSHNDPQVLCLHHVQDGLFCVNLAPRLAYYRQEDFQRSHGARRRRLIRGSVRMLHYELFNKTCFKSRGSCAQSRRDRATG